MRKNEIEKNLKNVLKRKVSFSISLFVTFLITGVISFALENTDIKNNYQINEEQIKEKEDKNYQFFFNFEYLKNGKSKDRTSKEFAETIREVNKYYEKEVNDRLGKDKVVEGNGVVVGSHVNKETHEPSTKVKLAGLSYFDVRPDIMINALIPKITIGERPHEIERFQLNFLTINQPVVTLPTVPNGVTVNVVTPSAVDTIAVTPSPITTPIAPTEKNIIVATPIAPEGYEPVIIMAPEKPATPTTPEVTVLTPINITFQGTGFGQGTATQFNVNQGIAAMNFISYSSSGIEITANETTVSWIGTMTAGGNSNLPSNSSYTFSAFNTFISDVSDHNVDVTGNYTMKSTATTRFPMFVSLNPYEVGRSSSADKTFDFKGTLTLYGVSSGSNGGILGFEHQLLAGGPSGTTNIPNNTNGNTTSILKNSGTIDLHEGYNMIGIMIDTEYINNNQNSYFRKRPQTRNDGIIKISAGAYKSIGIDFGYYRVHNTANLRGPNSDVYLGNIEIDGQQSYGYRQKYYGNQYYDMTTFNGSNGIIKVRGSQNVGISIAEGMSTGDPISNASGMQIQVGGSQNIGFLRNSNTSATNNTAIVLDSTKLGNTFDFLPTATQSTLIRSDINEIILDKNLTLTAAGIKNSVMQAGDTGTVTLNTGRIISADMDQFYVLSAGDFLSSTGAKVQNRGTIILGGDQSIGIAVATGNSGVNSGNISYTGNKGTGIYNLGTFDITAGTLSADGQESGVLFNKNGTVNITGGIVSVNTSNGATGIYSDAGIINSTIGSNLTISVDDITNTKTKGIAIYAENGATVNLQGVKIDAKESAAGVASSGTSTHIDLQGAELKYSGNGYAAYSDGAGTINLSDANLVLAGKATGVELDLLSPKVTLNNTTITMMSDEATVANLKNTTGLITSNLKTLILNSLGTGINVVDGFDGVTTFNKYKIATVDGGNLTFDANMDKYNQNDTSDGYFYSRRFLGQRLNLTVNAGITVTGSTDTAYAGTYFNNQVVGLEMNSSTSATSATDAQINLLANSKVIADRTDAGNGAIGLYMNFGKIDIANGASVEVEKVTGGGNVVNSKAVGVYAVNGSTISNAGDITVGGNQSIGILGMAYREKPVGTPIVGEFGTGGIFADQGKVNITNSKNITLDGTGTVGIYADNNNALGTKADTAITNTAAGIITVGDSTASNAAIGIYGEKATISNLGTISVGDGGVAIYAKEGTEITNLGTLDLGDDAVGVMTDGKSDITATSVTLTSNGVGNTIRAGILYKGTGTETKNINMAIDASAFNKGIAVYVEDMSVVSTGTLDIGQDGVGIFVKGSTANTGTNKSNINLVASKTGAIGMYSKRGNLVNDTTGVINLNDLTQTAIYGEGTNTKVLNNGIINLNVNGAKGIYIKDGATAEINGNNIAFIGNTSIGTYAENAVVKIKNNISFAQNNENKNMFIYGKGATVEIDAGRVMTVNGMTPATTPGNKTVGIYLENAGTGSTFMSNTTGQLNVINEAVGIYSKGNNNLNVNITATGEKTIGTFIESASTISGTATARGATVVGAVGVYANGGAVTVGSGGLALNTDLGKGTGMYLTNGAYASGGAITVNNTATGTKNIGLYYSKGTSSSTVTNGSAINLIGNDSIGIYAADGITMANNTNITSTSGRTGNIASYAGGGSQLTSSGTITMNDNDSIGIYVEEGRGINSGAIVMNGVASTPTTSVVGMAAEAKVGKTAAAENASGGTITAGANLGMYVGGAGASSGRNAGTISAATGTGVYVDGVANNFNGTGGTISAGKIGMYLKDTGTNKIIAGALNIGSGGVGIYGENAEIDFAVITAGTGVIGVAAKDNTVISGNVTVDDDSIGVYVLDNTVILDGITVITGVENSRIPIGIFYKDTVGITSLSNVNIDAKDGIGVYLGNDTGIPSGVTLAFNGHLKTENGVGIYVPKYASLTAGNTTIDINGGTGIYIDEGTANLALGGNLIFNFGANGGIGIFNNGGNMTVGNNAVINGMGSFGVAKNGSWYSTGNFSVGEKTAGLLGEYDNSMLSPQNITNTGVINVFFGGIGLAAIVGPTSPTFGVNIINTGTITSSGQSSNNNLAIGIYSEVADIVNSGNITVGSYGIGIYTNAGTTPVSIQNDNINLIGVDGIGVYIKGATDGFTTNNINSATAGNTGVVLEGTAGNINLGTIALGDESIGVIAVYGTNATVNGNISVGDRSDTRNSVGIAVSLGTTLTIDPAAQISAGINGIGIYAETAATTVNIGDIGKVSVGDNGIYVYSEGAGINFTGNLLVKNQIGIVADGGSINASNSSITVQDGGIGIYVKEIVPSFGTTTIDIHSGREDRYSIGVYYDSVPLIGTAPTITDTGDYTIGMMMNNSTGVTPYGFTIGNVGSHKIGLAAKGNSTLTVGGDITVNGDNNIGNYGENSSITVNGDILIGNSSEDNELKKSSIGSYLKTGVYKGTGSLTVGNYGIGVYAEKLETGSTITQTGSDMSVGKHGVGIFASGDSEVKLVMNNKIAISSENSVGVYTENVDSSVNGNMDIGSDSSIGILSLGTGNINYSGNIDIADKNTAASAGIYKIGGTGIITVSGDWNIGISGYGIYAQQQTAATAKALDSITINNNADMTLGTSAIGIFSEGNNKVNNFGNIKVGATNTNGDPSNLEKHENSVGIYLAGGSTGLNTTSGNITVNYEHSVGVYVTGLGTSFINEGIINIDNGGIGILVQNKGTAENKGTINLGSGLSSSGVSSLGMAAYNGGTIFNSGTVNVDKGTGIYVGSGAAITNTGTINVNNGIGVEGKGTLVNSGTINVTGSGTPISTSETSENLGSVVIKPDGTIYINDKYVAIGGTLTTLSSIVVKGAYVDVTTKTPLFNASNITGEVKILPNFALTGNGISYEIKGFVNTASGTVDGNKLSAVTSPMFVSKITDKGDLVIAKVPYADLTIGSQYDALDKGLDNILRNSNGIGRDADILKGLNSYLDGLPEENFAVETERKIAQTRGDIYATIQRRMQDINRAFDNSFYEMESSNNFTDDSNKFSVIYTDGNYKDGTTGIDDYDYKVIGLMYMKEKEDSETGDKYGYTLGFAGSKFKFKDDGGSKEDVYSLRAGVHRVKNLSEEHKVSWLTRAELGYDRHIAKRKLALHKAYENKGEYNTYSVSLDNKLNKVIHKDTEKELNVYGELNLEYGKVGSFTEKAGSKGGLEVRVKDNDYLSAEVGIGLKGKQRIYAKEQVSVRVIGDVKYAYELGDNYDGNKAKLKNGDEGYYSLITPEKKKGAVIGKIGIAIEKENHMGVTFEVEAANEQHRKDTSIRYGVRFNYKF
ncbi:autotransporter-associated N-terminal domain-containing protein [Fusobacterium sp.]|uniref:autotransporter-associated N-terminal domain-containing protein n=1 Tax=Fusobacterium sp. TaxID=68766 RepID=UPI0028FDDDA9|nr:autotransporter-associated N-terminal domain-containing protein [Fusobacterium sp.]MDU1910174.1 autotransporter-associated N-terminal domain-containing protein [Fusobacterium sp.]